MSIHISNKKVNDIHVGTKKVLTTWIGTDRVYLASTLSMLIKGYTEKSGDSLLSANTPLKFTGENLFDNDNGVIYETKYGTLTNNNGKITITNVSIYINVMYPVITLKTPLKPNKDYTIMVKSKNYNYTVWMQNNSNDYSKNISSNGLQDGKFRNINSTNEIKRLMFQRTIDPNADNDDEIELTIVEGTKTQYYFEPYHETIYNPTEGFSLNGIEGVEDTLNTDNGEHIVKFTNVDLGELDYFYDTIGNRFGSSNLVNQIKKPSSNEIVAKIMSPLFTTVSGNDSYQYAGNNAIAIDRNGALWITKKEYDNEQSLKQSMSGIIATIELATPQTYQKKPKVLPQWVKHVFDSSGRELEATITQ